MSFSRDGKLVVAAGRRDDPVKSRRWDRCDVRGHQWPDGARVPQKAIRWAALAPDGRMVVVATSHGGTRDTHFIGHRGRDGPNPLGQPAQDQRAGFYPVADMQFEAKSPWFRRPCEDGNVIRFNGLTGHEQRRFLAEWRTPEQQKAKRPRAPDLWEATFSADGRTLVSSQMEWVYVWDAESGTMRRKISIRTGTVANSRSPPTGARWRPRTVGTRGRLRRGHDPPV